MKRELRIPAPKFRSYSTSIKQIKQQSNEFREIKEEPPPLEIVKPKYKPRKRQRECRIVFGQKVYLFNELDKVERIVLRDDGFIKVREKSLNGKEQDYFIFKDKFEFPRHLICVKEIVDYLKQFTEDITTYRTAMPDIVFNSGNKKYAIEVETGSIIRDRKKMENKLELLNKRFGNNWFFFVTNRNLEKDYSKLGETTTKRNIKFKIRKIFNNSER